MSAQELAFYFVGGTVPNDAPSYVTRKADEDLLAGLRRGQFCYVLTSRQMGKSSLMVRAANRLRGDGYTCAVLDLTSIGQNLTIERWYDGLLNMMGWQLDLEDELEAFWEAHSRLVPLQRFTRALQEVVLKRIPGPVVLFVDEVDAVRSLPFSADEFFAGIRECFNRRAEEPEFARLTFALFGVASPSDLIRDTRTTPFNVGHRIELTDFTPAEAAPLAEGLAGRQGALHATNGHRSASPSPPESGAGRRPSESRALLDRILYWTGGHPYLTQRLCQAVSEAISESPARASGPGRSDSDATDGTRRATEPMALVDRLCSELFLSPTAVERDDNLIFVRERLLRSEVDVAALLTLLGRIRSGRPVDDQESNQLVSVLKLSGVVRAQDGLLRVRNRIYERVFDRRWIEVHMPGAELQRQRAAYRLGIIRATGVAAALLLTLGGLALIAVWEAAKAREVSGRLLKAENTLKVTLQQALLSGQLAKTEAKNAEIAKEHEKRLLKREQSARSQTEVQKQAAINEKENALRQTGIARREGRRAESAGREALKQLRLSYYRQAQAERWSGRPGQRFDSLRLLAKAATMSPPPDMQLGLRNEAIACMALPTDLELERRWKREAPGAGVCGEDPARHRVFVADAQGRLHIRREADGREIEVLSSVGSPPLVLWRCSPDGRYAIVTYGVEHQGTISTVIWDLAERRTVATSDYWGKIVDVSPDSRLVAYRVARQTITIDRLPAGGLARQFTLLAPADSIRFSPDSRRLAVATSVIPKVEIHDVRTGAKSDIRIPDTVNNLDWSPDGTRLAGTCRNGHIYIWDAAKGTTLVDMEGLENAPQRLEFNHRGNMLVSIGWDNVARFWDAATGKPWLTSPISARTLAISPDDSEIEFSTERETSAWRLGGSAACRQLSTGSQAMSGVAFSTDGRLLAVSGDEVQLWDMNGPRLAGRLDDGPADTVAFTPDGSALITYGLPGVELWPLSLSRRSASAEIGPPVTVEAGLAGKNRFCMSRDGSQLAVIHQSDHIHLVPLRGGALRGQLHSQQGMSYVAISKDRRWVASGAWQGTGVKVWDLAAKKLAKTFELPYQANVEFTPDGRWLVTGTVKGYQLWRTGTWAPGLTIPRKPGAGWPGNIAFAPDGRTLAVTLSDTEIDLVDWSTDRSIATLTAPQPKGVTWIRFSPDGSRLAATCSPGEVQLWDLQVLRHDLARIGLDWEGPHAVRAETGQPAALRVSVLSADAPPAAAHLVERLTAILSRAPENVGARIQRAEAYLALDEPKLAAADLAAAARGVPNNPALCDRIAWAYVCRPAKLNDPESGLPLALRATQLAPSVANYYHTLAVIYYRLGRLDDAMAAWKKDLSAPNSVATAAELFFFAMVYQKQGKPAEARAAYKQAVEWRAANRGAMGIAESDLAAAQSEAETVLGLH